MRGRGLLQPRADGRSLDWSLLLRQARADFGAQRPGPAALTTLANWILAVPDAEHGRSDGSAGPVATEQLAAAVEYLDATTRVAPELIDVDTVEQMLALIEATTRVLRRTDPLAAAAQHLSAAASVALLTGRPARGLIDPAAADALVAEARTLLGVLEQRSLSGGPMAVVDIWTLRVVGDALDLAGAEDGRVWMRFADTCRSGSAWSAALQQRLAVAPVAGDTGPTPPLTDQAARLRDVARTWNTVSDLPEVAALQSRRHRHGRGLIGEHNRVRGILNRRAWPLAAVFLGSVALAFLVAKGEQIREGRPMGESTFSIDLPAGEALAMSSGLFAVAGAVAVALAVLIRPESSLPAHYQAARRWWTVGTIVILICGLVSVVVGVLELLSRDQDSWWAAGLTVVIGALNFVLAFGISQWQEEPRLLAWTERHDLEALQDRLAAERHRLPEGSDRFWLPASALAAVMAAAMALATILNAAPAGRVTLLAVGLALVAGGAALPVGLGLVRLTVEWRRLRLTDPRGTTAQVSLMTAVVGAAGLLAAVSSVVLLLSAAELSWLAFAVWLGALLGFLLVLGRSAWSVGWPTAFVRRRALRLAEGTPDERTQYRRQTREG